MPGLYATRISLWSIPDRLKLSWPSLFGSWACHYLLSSSEVPHRTLRWYLHRREFKDLHWNVNIHMEYTRKVLQKLGWQFTAGVQFVQLLVFFAFILINGWVLKYWKISKLSHNQTLKCELSHGVHEKSFIEIDKFRMELKSQMEKSHF